MTGARTGGDAGPKTFRRAPRVADVVEEDGSFGDNGPIHLTLNAD